MVASNVRPRSPAVQPSRMQNRLVVVRPETVFVQPQGGNTCVAAIDQDPLDTADAGNNFRGGSDPLSVGRWREREKTTKREQQSKKREITARGRAHPPPGWPNFPQISNPRTIYICCRMPWRRITTAATAVVESFCRDMSLPFTRD